MSHDGSWRAACHITIYFLWLHFETLSIARGVTDPGVGSGALLARFYLLASGILPKLLENRGKFCGLIDHNIVSAFHFECAPFAIVSPTLERSVKGRRRVVERTDIKLFRNP